MLLTYVVQLRSRFAKSNVHGRQYRLVSSSIALPLASILGCFKRGLCWSYFCLAARFAAATILVKLFCQLAQALCARQRTVLRFRTSLDTCSFALVTLVKPYSSSATHNISPPLPDGGAMLSSKTRKADELITGELCGQVASIIVDDSLVEQRH